MNVSDVMTSNPVVIRPSESVTDALDRMAEVGCHHLPVVSSQKHVIGILSFNDCQRALSHRTGKHRRPPESISSQGLPVASAMTPAPIIVEPNEPATEAARLMLSHHIGCLPVMRGETLVGIVTRSDILMAFILLVDGPNRPAASPTPSTTA